MTLIDILKERLLEKEIELTYSSGAKEIIIVKDIVPSHKPHMNCVELLSDTQVPIITDITKQEFIIL